MLCQKFKDETDLMGNIDLGCVTELTETEKRAEATLDPYQITLGGGT